MLRRWTLHATALAGALAMTGCPGRATVPRTVAPVVAERPIASAPSTSTGEPTGALRVRVEAVAQAFRERGAQPLAERWMAFLPRGAVRTVRVVLDREVCLGFVAVGRESLTDIDLEVHNATGVRIAQDVRNDAHPYLRVCGRGGDELFVAVAAVRGAGEVALLSLAEPPVVPPDLSPLLGTRASGSLTGPRTPRAAIGADPATPDAPLALERMVQRLAPVGYRRMGAVLEGTLAMQRQIERRVRLNQGTCYAIVAAGGPGVEDLDLLVASSGGALLGRDIAVDNHPAVKVCPLESGEHRVAVRMYAGAGRYALAVLAMDPALALNDDVVGLERALALELGGEARRYGMAPLEPPVRAGVVGGVAQSFPVQVQAGRCYLFGAAPSESLFALDLSFVGDQGEVLAAGNAVRAPVRLFVCPSRSMQARVEVRPVGGRGEYLYLAFEGRGSPP